MLLVLCPQVADRDTMAFTCAALSDSELAVLAMRGAPILARTKVQQARALLGQGDFDEAERIAQEAAALNVDFGPKEDRPENIGKASRLWIAHARPSSAARPSPICRTRTRMQS